MCNCERKRFRNSINHIKVKCFFWLQLLMIVFLLFCIPLLLKICKTYENTRIQFCKNTANFQQHKKLVFKCRELVSWRYTKLMTEVNFGMTLNP